jgi:hypothetical protein
VKDEKHADKRQRNNTQAIEMSAEATSGGSVFYSVSGAQANENEDRELFKESARRRCTASSRASRGGGPCILQETSNLISEGLMIFAT